MEKELQVIANRYGVNYRNRTEDSIFGIYGSLRFDEHTGRCVLTFQDHGKHGGEPISGTVRTRYAIRRLTWRGIRRKGIVRTGPYGFTASIPTDNKRGALLTGLRLIRAVDPRQTRAKAKKATAKVSPECRFPAFTAAWLHRRRSRPVIGFAVCQPLEAYYAA